MALWPSSVPIKRVQMLYDENVSMTQSRFTRQRQVVTLSAGSADRYAGVITTPKLTSTQMQTLFDFLISTGLYGQFTINVPGWTNPSSPSTLTCLLTSIPEGVWDAAEPQPISVSFEEVPS